LIIDKSKSKPEIREFNDYIFKNLRDRVNPKIQVNINHLDSKLVHELQAIDMFAWGIFWKHEKRDIKWYKLFQARKIKFEKVYLS